MSATPFEPGERVLLVDQKDRTYLFRLQAGASYHTHSGNLDHDALIGQPEGTKVATTKGMVLVAFRPRLADFILKMPRGAQVVYPKDIGTIVTYGDICPGATVLEAGTGSGALTLALLNAVGPKGSVISYDLREEHTTQAVKNIEAFLGKVPDNLVLRQGDVRDAAGTDEVFDRVVLDLPEPWHVLTAVAPNIRLGGVVCAYLPTTIQIQDLVVRLEGAGFMHIETFETLRRGWHVTERSVRPDHRMQGHTGFLTIARKVGIPA